MRVLVNGEARDTEADTLAGLLREVGVEAGRIAVEMDRTIVPRKAYETTMLAENARIEIVRFVSGG